MLGKYVLESVLDRRVFASELVGMRPRVMTEDIGAELTRLLDIAERKGLKIEALRILSNHRISIEKKLRRLRGLVRR